MEMILYKTRYRYKFRKWIEIFVNEMFLLLHKFEFILFRLCISSFYIIHSRVLPMLHTESPTHSYKYFL